MAYPQIIDSINHSQRNKVILLIAPCDQECGHAHRCRASGDIDMKIGKQEPFSTIATSDADSITIRGKDLCSEPHRQIELGRFLFFPLTGEMPTPQQSFFVNATLCHHCRAWTDAHGPGCAHDLRR